ATLNLLKMAHEDISMELRSAIAEAKKTQKIVVRKGMLFSNNGVTRSLNMEVIPLKPQGEAGSEEHYLIVFIQNEAAGEKKEGAPQGILGEKKYAVRQIERLERELSTVKEHLRATLEGEELSR